MTTLLAAYLHNINPYAIKLWEGGPIRWYAVSYLLGFIIAFLLIRRVTRVGISKLKPHRVSDYIVIVAIGLMVGGRLGYVLFYRQELLWDFSTAFPFWGVLKTFDGGMASHGGIIGAVLAAGYFGYRNKIGKRFMVDLLAFGAPLGLFFGRIANFINGELVGRPCSENFIFAVKFPQDIIGWSTEKWFELLAVLPDPSKYLPQGQEWEPGAIMTLVQKADPAVVQTIEPLLTSRHPSQLYAAVLEGLVVFAVLAIAWIKPRRPGTITSLCLITYGCVRIFDELFRAPDPHLGFQLFGLTRGQWLSVPVVLCGIVGLVLVCKSKANPVGSWRRGPWTTPIEDQTTG
jgi:phosphatidylglycerol:prolipoprotein diacylglycerol transferase